MLNLDSHCTVSYISLADIAGDRLYGQEVPGEGLFPGVLTRIEAVLQWVNGCRRVIAGF